MDDSSPDRLPSDSSSNEIGCMGDEESGLNIAGDDCDKYHDQYYLEMFRHALRKHDQQARRWLQNHFSVKVLDLVHCHPSRDLACRLHSEEYYVIETFRRFWQTPLYHQEFEFKNMADVLYYLRVCLNAAILDALRSYSRQGEALLPESLMVEEFFSNDDDSSREVWRIIEEKLSDARKSRLAFLLFHCALRPVEIVRSCPNEFKDEHEVSRIRRDIMELLSH